MKEHMENGAMSGDMRAFPKPKMKGRQPLRALRTN